MIRIGKPFFPREGPFLCLNQQLLVDKRFGERLPNTRYAISIEPQAVPPNRPPGARTLVISRKTAS
jgi:hypothetical protein